MYLFSDLRILIHQTFVLRSNSLELFFFQIKENITFKETLDVKSKLRVTRNMPIDK